MKYLAIPKDAKKAAGRALGTIVELITFFLLRSWDFERFLGIERRLPEYRNDEITHNVEYSLHPSQPLHRIMFSLNDLPITAAKIRRQLNSRQLLPGGAQRKNNELLSRNGVVRHGCVVAETAVEYVSGTLTVADGARFAVSVSLLLQKPFAMVECKRVGIEEGARKGPQTIEKAKQGAYVARTVSSLQRIRLDSGEMGGVLQSGADTVVCKPYTEFLEEIISSDDKKLLRDFVLTIGVVSNHGNWFTSDNPNKELRVLAQSYDWLIFLSDKGLSEFLVDLVLHPSSELTPVRDAFLASYTGTSGKNRFTKVKMDLKADLLLSDYFTSNQSKVEQWFNVISPASRTLDKLREELLCLVSKEWRGIHT